jgi:hypothetical protein
VAAGAASSYLGHTAGPDAPPRRGYEPGYQQLLKARDKIEAEQAKVKLQALRQQQMQEYVEKQHAQALFARAAQFAT